MNLKVLLFGSSGLVGSRFVELSPYGNLAIVPTHEKLDLTDRNSVWAYLQNNKFDIIINFAAYTNVGEGEKQRDDKNGDCWKINVSAVENILQAIDSTTHFIQISTDMVFPGSADKPGPYSEDDEPEKDSNKVTWYGYTKAIAEQKVKEWGGNWTIVRLIYPVRAKFDKKLDYLRKPLKLYDEGKLYPMFTDQQISISFIDEICQALDKIISERKTGIFHVRSSNTTTPYELVSYLLEKTRKVKDAVKQSSLKEFLKTVDNPVRYPEFGGLNSEKTERELRINFSTWKKIVDTLVNQGISV